ncbi:MAG: GatB/YqeY domain-containing protein [Dehalococcoidia bacterium]|nr:GatB/YqeY domain-containing protein [Dehalococcoidia bacterium]
MSLREQLQSDLAQAMRDRDEIRKGALRMLVAAVRNAEIPAAPGKDLDEAELARRAAEDHHLSDDAVLAVIQKQVKQRQDSIDQYRKANRDDLAAKEEAEIAVFQVYLPQQAARDEIEAAARKVIADTGAAGPKDMGKVMPVLSKQFAGRADGRTINEVVRALLGS